MKYSTQFPKGGTNKMSEPMHITAELKSIKNLTIQGRTYTRDGYQLRLLDKDGQEIGKYNYIRGMMEGPLSPSKPAKDVVEDINLLLELAGKKTRILPEQFVPVMKEVISKCESRYGNPIPDSDYEVLVMFQ